MQQAMRWVNAETSFVIPGLSFVQNLLLIFWQLLMSPVAS